MFKYKITLVSARAGIRNIEVDANGWGIDSDFIFFFRKEEGKDVRTFGVHKAAVVRIEQAG